MDDQFLQKVLDELKDSHITMSETLKSLRDSERTLDRLAKEARCTLGEHELNFEMDPPSCFCGHLEVYYA
jgi:hypothetical protein